MSIVVTLSMKGDAKKLEEHAASDPEAMKEILESAKEHGLIAHRFYGTEDGDLMVVDEWPDAQSFQTFFEQASDKIGPLMQAAGVTSEPTPTFWRKLDTQDEYGWDA
jgi:heme-degrading monooxygenase HmoA